tara:strand:- start:433 stop:735 length:303 start_codon:yes stop_codon:yes gene_type:complete
MQAIATNHECTSMRRIGLDQLGITTQSLTEIQSIVILGREHVRTTLDQELVKLDSLNSTSQAIGGFHQDDFNLWIQFVNPVSGGQTGDPATDNCYAFDFC